MKRRQLTKSELLAQARQLRKLEKTQTSSPWTVMSVTMNWVLWKTEGWGQKRLVEFNSRVFKYYNDENTDVCRLIEKVAEKSENLRIRVVYYENYSKGSSYRATLENRLRGVENAHVDVQRKYLAIAYTVLIDLGYGAKRLNRVNDAVLEKMNSDESSAQRMHGELRDYAGVYIEMPSL